MKIAIENLSLAYDHHLVIDQINLVIEGNGLIILFGPNGAGKTTLLKSIAGLVPPSSGQIQIGTHSLYALSHKKRAKLMAYIPQHTTLPLDHKVFDFVLTGVAPQLSLLSVPSSDHRQQARDVLASLSLDHLIHYPLNQLSGGQRQSVYLARALVQNTPILLLDEPTAHLDYQRQHGFFQQLLPLVQTEDKTIILSLHDPNLALRYADRIIVIDNQKILADIDCHQPQYAFIFQNTLTQLYHHPMTLLKQNDGYMVSW